MDFFRKKPAAQTDSSFFPQRAMTLDEAVEIHRHCVELSASGAEQTMVMPLSELPPGGYVALVEAMARVYVLQHPVSEDDGSRLRFRVTLTMFADSVPDCVAILLEDLHGGRRLPDDPGIRLAQAHAVALRDAVLAVQSDYGYRAFEERVDQLRAR